MLKKKIIPVDASCVRSCLSGIIFIFFFFKSTGKVWLNILVEKFLVLEIYDYLNKRTIQCLNEYDSQIGQHTMTATNCFLLNNHWTVSVFIMKFLFEVFYVDICWKCRFVLFSVRISIIAEIYISLLLKEIKFKLPKLTIYLIIIGWLILSFMSVEDVLVQKYSIDID